MERILKILYNIYIFFYYIYFKDLIIKYLYINNLFGFYN